MTEKVNPREDKGVNKGEVLSQVSLEGLEKWGIPDGDWKKCEDQTNKQKKATYFPETENSWIISRIVYNEFIQWSIRVTMWDRDYITCFRFWTFILQAVRGIGEFLTKKWCHCIFCWGKITLVTIRKVDWRRDKTDDRECQLEGYVLICIRNNEAWTMSWQWEWERSTVCRDVEVFPQ